MEADEFIRIQIKVLNSAQKLMTLKGTSFEMGDGFVRMTLRRGGVKAAVAVWKVARVDDDYIPMTKGADQGHFEHRLSEENEVKELSGETVLRIWSRL